MSARRGTHIIYTSQPLTGRKQTPLYGINRFSIHWKPLVSLVLYCKIFDTHIVHNFTVRLSSNSLHVKLFLLDTIFIPFFVIFLKDESTLFILLSDYYTHYLSFITYIIGCYTYFYCGVLAPFAFNKNYVLFVYFPLFLFYPRLITF